MIGGSYQRDRANQVVQVSIDDVNTSAKPYPLAVGMAYEERYDIDLSTLPAGLNRLPNPGEVWWIERRIGRWTLMSQVIDVTGLTAGAAIPSQLGVSPPVPIVALESSATPDTNIAANSDHYVTWGTGGSSPLYTSGTGLYCEGPGTYVITVWAFVGANAAHMGAFYGAEVQLVIDYALSHFATMGQSSPALGGNSASIAITTPMLAVDDGDHLHIQADVIMYSTTTGATWDISSVKAFARKM